MQEDNQNFPPQVYIRTGIRLLGDSVITQNDIVAGNFVENSIALGSWKYDMHVVSRTAVKGEDGQLYANNEGAMFTGKEEGKYSQFCTLQDVVVHFTSSTSFRLIYAHFFILLIILFSRQHRSEKH